MDPLEVSELSQEENKELKKYIKGPISEFIRVGPKGCLVPKLESIMKQLSFYYNFKVRKNDTFVAAFPRSGTTMTQELVWLIGNNLDYETASIKHIYERYYICMRAYISDSLVNATKLQEYQQRQCEHVDLLKRVTWPFDSMVDNGDERFIMTHFPFSMLPPDTLDTAKVVYVARNPLDVAVSKFHLYRSLSRFEYVENFSEFWHLFSKDLVRYTPYFPHVKQAWEKRNHPNMLFLFYEDYIKDLPGAIRKICTFLNKSYSDEQIEGLCEHMKFENIQKNESVNLNRLKEYNILQAKEQPFVRKGKSGGWRDYFDEEMTKQAAIWIENNLRDTDLRFPGLDVSV